jgi:hypothetical protein
MAAKIEVFNMWHAKGFDAVGPADQRQSKKRPSFPPATTFIAAL